MALRAESTCWNSRNAQALCLTISILAIGPKRLAALRNVFSSTESPPDWSSLPQLGIFLSAMLPLHKPTFTKQ